MDLLRQELLRLHRREASVVIKESPLDQAATEEEVAAKYAEIIGVEDA